MLPDEQKHFSEDVSVKQRYITTIKRLQLIKNRKRFQFEVLVFCVLKFHFLSFDIYNYQRWYQQLK